MKWEIKFLLTIDLKFFLNTIELLPYQLFLWTKEIYDNFQTHLTFGREFTQAVELKQVAQQDAEKARFLVEKAEQQKKAAVISAEGDAKAAELIAKSLQDAGDGLVELRRIEAAEDIANKLSKSRQVLYLPTGQNTLLNLPQ